MSKKTTSATAGQFGLFDTGMQTGASAPPVPVALPAAASVAANSGNLSLDALGAELLHPYSRYGLAVAAYQAGLSQMLTEEALRAALVAAIETGLERFRMRTHDDSRYDKVLKFEPVRLSELVDKPQLIEGKLAAQGIYLFPTIVTADGKGGPGFVFGSATDIIKFLKNNTALSARMEIGRSIAPTTQKINHNAKASQTSPKGSLLEAACAIITTISPFKPAALVELGDKFSNSCIIPDLPLSQLCTFVEVFDEMSRTENKNLMLTREKPVTIPANESVKKGSKAAAKPDAPEFRRPRLHSGNYPDAPRDAGAFGAVGLLGAIGRWARRSQNFGQGQTVLESLAGQPLLLISYDQISQVRFDHHTTRLALTADLTGIVDSLYLGTRLYSEIDNPGTPFGKPAFKTFCLMAGRFLQSFTPAAFADFLAFRAEYAAEVEPLFTEYFRTMNQDIVQSAGELGRWLNRTAYFAAKAEAEEYTSPKKGKDQQIKETKAKILVVLESAVMSAKTPEEMISQVLTQAGRLLLDEAPAEARRFIDATNIGEEITHTQAKHLLTSYMRLRSAGKSSAAAEAGTENWAATTETPAE